MNDKSALQTGVSTGRTLSGVTSGAGQSPGQRPRSVARPWRGTGDSQEWQCQGWDRLEAAGGAWEPWDLILSQSSWVGPQDSSVGLPADLRLATPCRLASLCRWAEVSDSWLVSSSGGSSIHSGSFPHSF